MKKFIQSGVAIVLVAMVGGGLFAWSGFYNVAASEGHLPFVSWFLEFGMRNSVEFHASRIETPDLDDPALFERGIGHFQGGCAPCHGAPGFPPSPITRHMLPAPPELAHVIRRWNPDQLFWIIKHGFKYTGMPAWPAPGRDDEVWALVAFLVQLPDITPDEYRRLAFVDDTNRPDRPPDAVVAGLVEGDPIACARCHGREGEGSQAGGVPRLAGQNAEYLAMALTDYAFETRPSGIMGPVATYLGEEERKALADYYASLGDAAADDEEARRAIPAVDVETLQLGGAIAAVGIPSLSVPACDACHGEAKNPRYPALAGQHFAYLEQQMKLWRAGERGGTFNEIMSPVARNMTDEQIRAVSLYYANRGAR